MIDVHLLVKLKSKIRRKKKDQSVYTIWSGQSNDCIRLCVRCEPTNKPLCEPCSHRSLLLHSWQTKARKTTTTLKMTVRLNVMHERFETDDLECKICSFFCVQVVFVLSIYFIEAQWNSIWLLSFSGAFVAFIWLLYFHLERRSPVFCQKQLQNIVIIFVAIIFNPELFEFLP